MSYADPSLWFSWKGRINRQPYIFAGLATGAVVEVGKLLPESNTLVLLAYLPVLLVAAYVGIVLGIKRSHDRNKTGFFVLLFFLPFINLWPLVELVFFKGTEGENQYGPDPLSPAGPAAAAPPAEAAAPPAEPAPPPPTAPEG